MQVGLGAGEATAEDWLPAWSMVYVKPLVAALPTAVAVYAVAVGAVVQETEKVPYVAAVEQGGVKPFAAT